MERNSKFDTAFTKKRIAYRNITIPFQYIRIFCKSRDITKRDIPLLPRCRTHVSISRVSFWLIFAAVAHIMKREMTLSVFAGVKKTDAKINMKENVYETNFWIFIIFVSIFSHSFLAIPFWTQCNSLISLKIFKNKKTVQRRTNL